MEDNQEKLDLMMACYLGKWHPLYYGKIQVNTHGIGEMFGAIGNSGEDIILGIKPEKHIAKVRVVYRMMLEIHAPLPIDELDKSDKDFHIIFVTCDLLPRLGSAIEQLIEEPIEQRYQDLINVRDEWNKANNPTYTDRIVALCSRMKTVPSILKE